MVFFRDIIYNRGIVFSFIQIFIFMPDISLLQRDDYGFEEDVDRVPRLLSLITFIILLGAISLSIGIWFYQRSLVSQQTALLKDIEDIKTTETTHMTENLQKLGQQTDNLQTLRTSHASPQKMFSYLESSTHPEVYFTTATIDVRKNILKAHGFVPSASILVRQVEIYETDKQKKNIADFSIYNVGYGEKQKVIFDLDFSF